ncbi:MAG: hypothetical protein IPK82_26480 [Polyangiaceae bacterium]|nr:hypothetical protein [Polyangiaceae bacterium]
MRYGLIVAPTTLPDLRPAPGTLDSDLMRARLPQDDTTIDVVEIDPTVDVAEQIDRFFDTHREPIDALLFYASTLVATSPDGEVFLCLDPTNPDVGDSLRDVAAAMREQCDGAILFVLDCRHAIDEDDAFRSATVASAVRAAIDPARTGIELLVAAQPQDASMEDAASPFTRAFLAELDEGDPSRKLLAADVYKRIHGSERLLGVVPCFAHTKGREPFVMIEGDGSGRMQSLVDTAELGLTPAGGLPSAAALFGGALNVSAERVESAAVAAAPRTAVASESEIVIAAENAPEPAAMESATAATAAAAEPIVYTSSGAAKVEAVAETSEGAYTSNEAAKVESVAEAGGAYTSPTPAKTSAAPPAIGTGDRAAASAVVRLSERPPAADTALPKVMISERPPPAPAAEIKSGTLRPPAVPSIEGAGAASGEAEKAAAPADEVKAEAQKPAEPEPPKEPTYADYVAAGEALSSRDAEGALAEYKKALLLLAPAQKEERADVFVHIGRVKLLQDKRREAISNFEKATQLSPTHRGAIEEIVKLSVEERDWRGVAQGEEKILAEITDPRERFTRLLEFGDRWMTVAFDNERAKSAFDRAREIDDSSMELLARLLKIAEANGATAEAFDLRLEMADRTTDSHEQASRYLALGKECLDEQKDEDRALALFDRALEAEPLVLEPLAKTAEILAERQEWSELEGAYRRMIGRADRIADAGVRLRLRWELHRKLALLFRDHLEDAEGALRAFEKAIADRPSDMATRETAAALARELGKWDVARVHLQACSRNDPMVVQTYHDLFDVFQKLKRPDQAWAAASVTAQLGHADSREGFIYEEGKTDGPAEPTRALDVDGWDLLRDSGRDLAVEGVLEAIAKAAISAKIADLRAANRLPALDPAAKQDPKKSTVSIVRSFAWASHWLGVPMPAVYLREDAAVGLAAVIAEEPSVIAGSGVLRGKSLGELAFAAGRHLAYHYGAHRLLLYYPVIDDLAACFLAGIRLAMPDANVPAKMERATAAVAARMEPLLEAKGKAALERAVLAFDAAGSRADLNGWVASVERCSTRAGYLLCNDLRTVATSVAAEGAGMLSVEDKMVDILSFTVSEEFHALREELGIAIEP